MMIEEELSITTVEPVELSEEDHTVLQTGLTPIKWLDVEEVKELYPQVEPKEK